MAEARERPCQVCSHPDVEALNMAVVNGKSLRAIATDFGYTYTRQDGQQEPDHKAISRHRDKCMAEAYQHARANRDEATGAAMLDRLRQLDDAVDEQLARLRAGSVVRVDGVPLLNDDGSPVRKYAEADLRGAIREARNNLELRSKLAGANPEGDPDAADAARELLLSAEARKAIDGLEKLLAGDG